MTGGLISVGRGAYKQQFIVSSQAGSNHAISREVVCIHFSKQQTGFLSHSDRILARLQLGKCFLLLKIYLL